jgi:hypothetical protein
MAEIARVAEWEMIPKGRGEVFQVRDLMPRCPAPVPAQGAGAPSLPLIPR